MRRVVAGTIIGMNKIKQQRFNNYLNSYPTLRVSDCVPFYFCPRSIMLNVIFQANDPELFYKGGQKPIVHLVADLHTSTTWAAQNKKRWVFTLSNAGSKYFEDRNNLNQLDEINWQAVRANQWSRRFVSSSIHEGKQAEFLMEHCFPWNLIQSIGVHSPDIYQQVINILSTNNHQPSVQLKPEWYY